MPRFFLPVDLLSAAQIDYDASDATRLVAIHEHQGGYSAFLTLFDFALDLDHRANNRINTHRDEKTSIEGFLLNVLKLGVKYREVDESEYSIAYRRLEEKAQYLRTRKKRKLVITTSGADDNKPTLP